MPPEKFQNRYRIPSARASWHDYDDGAYFVTICTGHREHYFGDIYDGQMHMTAIGQIVANNLQTVSAHYQYAEIPLSVIMPNHLHAIVIIDGTKIPCIRRDNAYHDDNKNEMAPNATTDHRRDASRHVSTIAARHVSTIAAHGVCTIGKNPKMQLTANQSGWLSVCIGGIKSAITKYAHENKIDFEWQSRFHDHIVRDSGEMDRIANYIKNNVGLWESDCFY